MLDFSVGAWNTLLKQADFAPVAAPPGATFVAATAAAVAGGAPPVAAGTNLIAVTGVTFADATHLAQGLVRTTDIKFAAPLGAGFAHMLFAYTDGANTRIADVDLTGRCC